MNKSAIPLILGIEILRFLASLSVVLWHWQHFIPKGFGSTEWYASVPIGSMFGVIYRLGPYAVPLFWVMSGTIFQHVYADQIIYKHLNFKQFLIKRIARLYPLHIVTLVIVSFLQYLHNAYYLEYFVYTNNDPYNFGLNFLFIQGWGLQTGASFNAPTWSVSLEILIYILFFFITYYFKPNSASRLIIATSFLYLKLNTAEISNFGSLYFCGSCFYYGTILSNSSKYVNTLVSSLQNNILYSILFILIIPLINIMMQNESINNLVTKNDMLIVIILLSIVYIFSNIQIVNTQLKTKTLTLGEMTYSMYLWHFPLQIVMRLPPIAALSDEYQDWTFLAFYLLLLFIISAASMKYIERKLKLVIIKSLHKL